MERNTKRRIIAGIFALSCAALLASCDPVESLPLNYQDAIVNKDGQDADLYENQMGVIFDAVNSGKNDRVLEELLYRIGVDQFGSYATLKDLYEKAGTEEGKTAIESFCQAHKKTFVLENDSKLAEKDGYTVEKVRFERFTNFYEDLNERIQEVFYNEISSKSYNDEDNRYHEKRLAVAHYNEMYKIKDLDFEDLSDESTWYVKYLTPDFKKEDVTQFIHLDRYSDYIERKIIPQIYKDKMVEEYLFENNYSTLGRAYGRKVRTIKISHESKNIGTADKLFKDFADAYILDTTSTDVNFEYLANAWKGFKGLDANGKIIPMDAESIALLAKRGTGTGDLHEKVTITDADTIALIGISEYYKETQLADILDDYAKAIRAEGNRFAKEEDKTALNSFTNSGAQSKEKGLRNKLVDLALKDYTTEDWYVKNSGISELPSTLSNRLFNINVSNALDDFSADEMETKDKHDYATKGAKSYVRYINEHYYLTPSRSQQASADGRNFVIHDADSNSFIICEVVEAPSTAKLNIESDKGYFAKKANALFTEEVARDLAKKLGTKDSYVTDAQASYLELYALQYHDSAVYDYFKSKYPELFDDED